MNLGGKGRKGTKRERQEERKREKKDGDREGERAWAESKIKKRKART